MTDLLPDKPDYTVADVPRLLLTYAQAGDSIGVCERTIREMVSTGTLPHVRVTPGTRRIDPRDLFAFIDSHKKSK